MNPYLKDKKYLAKYIFFLGFILLIVAIIFLLFDGGSKDKTKNVDLEVVFLDVGQGDAIYI